MAKNFEYFVDKTSKRCLDKCSATDAHIGSNWCLCKCQHGPKVSTSANIEKLPDCIDCTKIIYRHANGKVVMRKH